VEWEGYITTDTKNVFAFLEKNSSPNDLLVGNARLVNYMANVYSSANSWLSHPYNTPRIAERQEQMNTYFASGIKPAEWNGRHILIVLDKREKLLPVIAPSLTSNKMFENNSYIIFTP
jgi:hypothetical protein